MSEKIYACLLRLFPSHFREAYGDEALQLFRDRTREEKGFFHQVGLWLDLLADLAISVPRQYRCVRPALTGTVVQQRLGSAPAFFVLADESPGPEALIFGCVLSMIALSTFSILLSHGGNHRPLSASGYQRGRATDSRPSTMARATGHVPGDAEDVTMNASRMELNETMPSDSQSTVLLPADSSPRPEALAPQLLDAAERKRLMNAVIDNLKQHYIDSQVARKMADALLAHNKNGDDDAVTDGRAFADLLTRQMREVSHDMHLEVVYSQTPLPDLLTEPSPEDLARYRKELEQDNCTFKKVEILPNNIGYLKLNAFPDPSMCQATATAAMASLNHADAIIFDLRDNRGGEPSMTALMAAYLFDHPEYWYNPRENTTEQSWTLSPVPANRLADKPVYVLTSARTFSGAEQFCYDLKMLKRATLIGEKTGGAAHAGVFHRIDDHFGMGIPEVKTINPNSKTDWAETGVEPDVKVKAADALETAKKLAESKLQRK
jgi:hypothetical protein